MDKDSSLLQTFFTGRRKKGFMTLAPGWMLNEEAFSGTTIDLERG
jgi:hypothetical protein